MKAGIRKYFGRTNYILFAALFFTLIIFFSLKRGYVLENQYSMQIEKINDLFMVETSDGVFNASLPGYLDTVDGLAVIKAPITAQMIDNGGIGFYSISTYVRVFLDDEMIYSNFYFDRHNDPVEVGNVWNHFEVEPFFKGKKELIIELRSLSDMGYIKMGNIYVGDQQDIFTHALKQDNYLYWIILVLQVIGIFALFFRFSYRKTMVLNPSIAMLGIGAIFASIAVFSFSNIVAFDFMGGYPLKLLGYSSIMLSMVSIAGHVVQIPSLEKRRDLMILMGFGIVWVLGMVTSHILVPRVIRPYLLFSFLIFLIAILGSCMILVDDLYRKGRTEVRLMRWSLFMLFLVIMLDVVLNYSTNIDGPMFSFVGTALFFAANTIFEIEATSTHHEWAAQMNHYKELARTDQMTGLKNRTCFTEDAEYYNKPTDKLAAISFDVDDLKTVNDNYGHAVGDDMIITAGDLINYCFARHGSCYRMSGDEFLCILEAEPVMVEALIKDFRKVIADAQKRKNYRFRVSAGVAYFDPKEDDGIEDVIARAEKEMYDDKKNGRSHPSGILME